MSYTVTICYCMYKYTHSIKQNVKKNTDIQFYLHKEMKLPSSAMHNCMKSTLKSIVYDIPYIIPRYLSNVVTSNQPLHVRHYTGF